MTRFIAVISGKGGVGKTSTTVNLAHALAQMNKRVLVVDANLATANVALHLGLVNPTSTLNQFLRKEKALVNTIHTHEGGFSFIPASPSFVEYQNTSPSQLSKLFGPLSSSYDFVLLDAPSGLGAELRHVLKHVDESLVVVNPTMSSVMEALKSVELARLHNNVVPGVVLNKSSWISRHELSKEQVEQIIGSPVLVNLRHDRKMLKSQHQHTPLTMKYPYSHNARRFKDLAHFIAFGSL